jgi:restriction system protein
MRRLWLVRLGKHGEQEAHALKTGELVLGFGVGDLRAAKDRDAVLHLLQQAMPDAKHRKQLNFAAQLNQFSNTIQEGDLALVPLKTLGKVAVGEVTGPCTPTAEGHPMRRVRWLKPELPRDVFRQDLLYSLGAFMTVCEISRNDALRRVEAIIKTGIDPGYESGIAAPPREPASPEAPTAEEAEVDLDEIARDQIERRVASVFTGHDFTRLVAEILKAQGYVVNVSPPGPDQSIDIVAGRGGLGFEAPRLVVQVKSGNVVADQPTLQALIGAVQDTHADQGLLVCWGGFKRPVEQRRNELFFRIRLWGEEQRCSAHCLRSMTSFQRNSGLNCRCAAPGCSFLTMRRQAHNVHDRRGADGVGDGSSHAQHAHECAWRL